MRTTTRIGGREVPIEPGEPTTVTFSGGRQGKSEAGPWEFWTAKAKRGRQLPRAVAQVATPASGFDKSRSDQ